jgi:hypothetical protein
MSTEPVEPPPCWHCRSPLTEVSITVAARGHAAHERWQLCSWACAGALVTQQVDDRGRG